MASPGIPPLRKTGTRMARYLLSLPERLVRSASALAGGLIRELGDVTLPASIRRTKTYQTMVGLALRFMIQDVGHVEGVYPAQGSLANDFLMRKTAGRAADVFNAPPLDVAALREEWDALRASARKIPPSNLPSPDLVRRYWDELKAEAAAQDRSVFALSSLVALAAISRTPDNLLRLTRAANRAVWRTGQLFAGGLLEHYSQTLHDIRERGYAQYWADEFRPYLRAAAGQFSPSHGSLTEKLLGIRETKKIREKGKTKES